MAALALAGLLAAACGSKSGLRVPRRAEDASLPDAGIDAGLPDASFDGGVDAGPMPDECIELPFREPPRELQVTFVARILSADIFFLVDVTGSMSEEIDQIRNQLREEIVPGLADEIPDVRFSVGHFADFPLPRYDYGASDDELYRVIQTSTGDLTQVLRAVHRLPLQGGLDFPEAMVEGLYLTATGEGFGSYVEPSSCPPSTRGYPCFRAEGSRIILAFTDAPSHNGPGGHDTYVEGTVTPTPHTYEETVNALRDIGAKVLGLHSGGSFSDGGREDLEALARDTGAVRPDGTPVVFDIGRDGRFLSDSVVEAVRTLVDEVAIGDVDLTVEDAPGDPFDATRFVEQVVAVSAEPPDGAVRVGDTFADVQPGTRLTFQILLANEEIPQTDEPQRFLMRVILRGDGVTRLQETLVEVVVPAMGGGTVCPP